MSRMDVQFSQGRARWLVGFLTMAGIAALIVAGRCVLVPSADDDLRASAQSAPALQRSESPTQDLENWVEMTAREGEGVIRVPVASTTSGSTGEEGPAVDVRVVTAGPLNAASLARLQKKLRKETQELERQLEQRIAASPDSSSSIDYQGDLEIAAQLERAKIEERMVQEGKFLTIAMGERVPPVPDGSLFRQIGSYMLESGKWGDVVIFVAPYKHPDLRACHEAIAEVSSYNRKEGIQKFNSRPFAELRDWAQRYFSLEARFRAGTAEMPAEDIAEYLAKKRVLQYLDAEVHPEWFILEPRQR